VPRKPKPYVKDGYYRSSVGGHQHRILCPVEDGLAGLGERKQSAGKVSQRFRRLFERCVNRGLIEKEIAGERLVPYSTRHTRITELKVEGVGHTEAMREAVHTNPLTTERYTHIAGSHVTQTVRSKSKAKAASGTAKSAGSAAATLSPGSTS
jgi:hypothetical protein